MAARPEPKIKKLLRALAYAAAVGTVVAALVVRSSYGRVKDHALAVGDELGKLGDVGQKTPIWLNGQPIHVGSSVHELSVAETLDRAERLCEDGAPQAGDGTGVPLPDEPATLLLEAGDRPASGIIRQERDGRGVVVCFAPPPGRPADPSTRERLRRWLTFLETGELDAIGRLRYLYARETDSGRTQLIRVWTDAPFNLNAMTSKDGRDTPGSDPADAPRPPESVRLLSATIAEAPYAARVYLSRVSASEVAAAYDVAMPSQGWEIAIKDGDARVYRRRDITVFVTPAMHEGRLTVSLLHMGAGE